MNFKAAEKSRKLKASVKSKVTKQNVFKLYFILFLKFFCYYILGIILEVIIFSEIIIDMF